MTQLVRLTRFRMTLYACRLCPKTSYMKFELCEPYEKGCDRR